jgi:hypothetical protein
MIGKQRTGNINQRKGMIRFPLKAKRRLQVVRARMPSDRSARDSVQAHRQTCDLSKSVLRKELTMADGSIADTSSKFSKES